MSTYYDVNGSLSFANRQVLDRVLNTLVAEKRIAEDNGQLFWIQPGSDGSLIDEPTVDYDNLTLSFPDASHRNFGDTLTDIVSKSSGGKLIGFTNSDTPSVFSLSSDKQLVVRGSEILDQSMTFEQIDIDLLTMDSESWERKYDEADYSEHMDDLLRYVADRL